MNLLQETLKALSVCKKTETDVIWVGSLEYEISWDDFKRLADREYNESYGTQEVASDLLIVGEDWHLERYEYDGSENWVYRDILKRPVGQLRKPRRIIDKNNGYLTLAEINKED